MIERFTNNGYLVGDSHPNATISDDQVEKLRRMRATGATYHMLSKHFGIASSTAFLICVRKSRSVPPTRKILVATPEDYPTIASLRAAGLSRAAIGRQLGATDSSIHKALVALNLNERPSCP